MVHRFKIRIAKPTNTTVNVKPPFNQLLSTLNTSTPITYLTSGTTVSSNNYKHITLPIQVEFNPTDYSDLIDNWSYMETRKAINKIENGETIKYTNYPGITINFRFMDKTTNTYSNTFTSAGFTSDEIRFKRNNFKKSFFRLYFYDSNSGGTQNLLFTEDLGVNLVDVPQLPLDRIYWLRDDDFFFNVIQDRVVYMEARFFNAKTGVVSRFMNLPTSITSQINVTTYSDVNNHDWRTSPIRIKNPNGNLGNRNFEVIPGVGANTVTTITMSEYVLL